MFNLYLPARLYELLPVLYLLAALVVAALDLSAFRWIAVAALALAAWLTHRRRRAYRRARRRAAIRERVAARYGKDVETVP